VICPFLISNCWSSALVIAFFQSEKLCFITALARESNIYEFSLPLESCGRRKHQQYCWNSTKPTEINFRRTPEHKSSEMSRFIRYRQSEGILQLEVNRFHFNHKFRLVKTSSDHFLLTSESDSDSEVDTFLLAPIDPKKKLHFFLLFDNVRYVKRTMSYSTYAPTFKVPDGFPELLAELTTEVLREQPESATGIYQLAYRFFLNKQQGGNAGQADGDTK
jgi:hypothetical protein